MNQAIAVFEQLRQSNDSLGHKERLGHGLLTKAEILLDAEQSQAATDPLEASLELLESVSQQIPESRRLKALVERGRQLQQEAK